MKDHDNDRLMTRQEVEDRFGVTKRYLELATMRGEGPRVVRVGRMVRYRVKDLHAWIESCTAKDGGDGTDLKVRRARANLGKIES